MFTGREFISVVDPGVLKHSRLARLGQYCLNAALILRICKPVALLALCLLLMLVALVDPALAQTSAGLGGDSSAPINAFRKTLDLGVWVLVGLGIFGVGWSIYNVMFGNSWGKQMIGGAGALGFAGIVALVNDLINDEAPPLPVY